MSLSTMNWKRGLMRLWAVVSIFWAIFVVYAIVKFFGDGRAWLIDIFYFRLAAINAAAGNDVDVKFVGMMSFYLALFIPPLLLLALGYIGLWVGRGFRR